MRRMERQQNAITQQRPEKQQNTHQPQLNNFVKFKSIIIY